MRNPNRKSLRCSDSELEKIDAVEKVKGEAFSKKFHRYMEHSVYLPPKARSIFREAFKEYGIEGPSFESRLIAFGEKALSHNGVENSEIEEFDCNMLCKKARTCVSNAMGYLGEIKTLNCFVSRYPYQWTTPDGRTVRLCKYMVFPNGFPHDPENPYPECIHPKPLVRIPRDHIIRDPQKCWTCYKLQKKAKQENLVKRAIRNDPFKGEPRVNWGF